MGLKPLFILDSQDTFAKDILDSKNIKDLIFVSYKELYKNTGWIRQICKSKNSDFVVFSRNDQVKDRINIGALVKQLRVGYTTFSSLEDENFEQNTKGILEDLMSAQNTASSSMAKKAEDTTPKRRSAGKTYSLIFDTEQLGCMKFGVPRILEVLRKHKSKATFFMTNIVKQVYPNIAEEIINEGYEIGLHGQVHEPLDGLPKDVQFNNIAKMSADMRKMADISGCNFIGRYDPNTIEAMIGNGLEYFVYDAIKRYSIFGYKRSFSQVAKVMVQGKAITAIPIDVETYGFPQSIVEKMINAAITQGKQHITILMHPFRDGSLNHIQDLEKTILFMKNLGFTATRLIDYNNSVEMKSIEIQDFFSKLKQRQVQFEVLDFIPQWTIRIRKKVAWPRVTF